MRKVILVMLVFAVTVAVPVARADQPIFIPLGFGQFTDTETCGFPVTVDVFANGVSAPGEVAKIFPSRRVIIAGPPTANGSVSITGVGHSVVVLQTAGGVTVAEVAGVVSYSPTNGPATLQRGKVLLDICAALAP